MLCMMCSICNVAVYASFVVCCVSRVLMWCARSCAWVAACKALTVVGIGVCVSHALSYVMRCV